MKKGVVVFSKKDIKALIKNAKFTFFPKNSVIFKKNDFGDFFYIIENGNVRIETSQSGKTKIFADLKDGDFFGELALLGVKYRTASAIATSDTYLYKIPKRAFINYINKNKKFCIKMLEILANRLKEADEEIERITFYSLLARVVLIIKSKFQEEKASNICLTQNDIAKYLGTTRIPINRIIAFLKRKKIIKAIQKGNIEIDPIRLEDFSKRKEIF